MGGAKGWKKLGRDKGKTTSLRTKWKSFKKAPSSTQERKERIMMMMMMIMQTNILEAIQMKRVAWKTLSASGTVNYFHKLTLCQNENAEVELKVRVTLWW